MKKQTITLATLLTLAGTFASCSQESEQEYTSNAGKEIVFNIGISEELTRTATIDKETSFITNDEIGIFGVKRGTTNLLDKNVKYTYSPTKTWEASPAIAFPIDQSNVDFYAYYPHVVGVESTTFDFSVSANQSEGYNRSDLLMSKNTTSDAVTDTSIELSFAHALALVEVTVTMPQDITLSSGKIYAQSAATIDLKAQTATLKASQSITAIEMHKEVSSTPNTFKFRAILPAQALAASRLLDFISTDGYVYSYSQAGPTAITAKKLNVISVTFN